MQGHIKDLWNPLPGNVLMPLFTYLPLQSGGVPQHPSGCQVEVNGKQMSFISPHWEY